MSKRTDLVFEETALQLGKILSALIGVEPTPPGPGPGPQPVTHENTILRYSGGITREYNIEGCLGYPEEFSYEKNGLVAIEIGTKVTEIGNATFSQCPDLTSVAFPFIESDEAYYSIGSWAFGDCPNLSAIVLTENCISIGDSSFSQCPLLTAVTFPHSLLDGGSIGGDGWAFGGDTAALIDITLVGMTKAWCLNDGVGYINNIGPSQEQDCIIHCTDGDLICRWDEDDWEYKVLELNQ